MELPVSLHSPIRPSAVARFRTALDGVRTYAGGMTLKRAAQLKPGLQFAKLASNENLLGPSSEVAPAVRAALGESNLYPDPYCEALRDAIGERLRRPASRIIVGPGSEALIDYLFGAVLETGEDVLISSPTFPRYAIVATALGAQLRDVPRRPDFALDVPAVTAEIRRAPPRILVLCTPNNPTGNALSAEDIEAILEVLPQDSFVLFDEAYHEYAGDVGAIGLLERWGGPFLVTRTFSKAYGLAGMRVGYGIAASAEIVERMDRLRPHFNVSNLAQAAALAAWRDQSHLASVVDLTLSERAAIEAALDDLGVPRTASGANFVFVRAARDLAVTADLFLSAGLMTRPAPVGEQGWLRISVGRPKDNELLRANLHILLPPGPAVRA